MDENNASNSSNGKRGFDLQPEYIVHTDCPQSTALDVNYVNLVFSANDMYSQSSSTIDSADKLLFREQPSPPSFSLPRIWPVAGQEQPQNRSESKIDLVEAGLDHSFDLLLQLFSPCSDS